MKKVIIFSLLISLNIYSFGQFTQAFNSAPDSSVVKLNGKIVGYTPCIIKYFWRQNENGKISFEVSHDGYKSWSLDVTEKPSKFDAKSYIMHDLIIPHFDLESNSAVVDFNLLVFDFQEGKEIGKFVNYNGDVTSIKWEGATKVGAAGFYDRSVEILMNAGFNTPVSKGKQLLDQNAEKKKLPRFIISANLLDYQINASQGKKDSYWGLLKMSTFMNIEWQVFDKVLNRVVYTKNTKNTFSVYESYYTITGKNIETFSRCFTEFLNDGVLYELVKNADGTVVENVPAIGGEQIVEIAKVNLPLFKDKMELIDYAKQSCVTVITDGGHGSGVIINENGYILTAYHVIQGVNKITIKFINGFQLDAKIIAFSEGYDVAILDVEGGGYKPLPFETEGDLMLGEELISIGTPIDVSLAQSISTGILSGNRKIEDRVYLQTNMALSPGNSGGPLLNSKGEIVGIVQEKIVAEGTEGIGFAIPVAKIVEELHIVIK